MRYYRYSLLQADGEVKFLEISDRNWPLERLQEAVGGQIEVIPPAYYPHQEWTRATVFGDEEARFKGKLANPHFTMFPHGQWMPPVVGDCILEEVIR